MLTMTEVQGHDAHPLNQGNNDATLDDGANKKEEVFTLKEKCWTFSLQGGAQQDINPSHRLFNTICIYTAAEL